MDTALARHSGTRAGSYLVRMGRMGRSVRQDRQLGILRGTRIRTVQGSAHIQGGRQACGALGQFFVVLGRNPAYAGEFGSLDDLAGLEQHPARGA